MKTKQGHTPGPWITDNEEYGPDPMFPSYQVRPAHWRAGSLATITTGNISKESAACNARLIAASPDLLAACDAAIALLDTTTTSGRKAYEMARAAIDKAEGR